MAVRTIVIGGDGSAASQAASRWALAQAKHHGATVRAVPAWDPPYYIGEIGHLAGESMHEPLERATAQTQDEALDAPKEVRAVTAHAVAPGQADRTADTIARRAPVQSTDGPHAATLPGADGRSQRQTLAARTRAPSSIVRPTREPTEDDAT